MLVVPQNAGVEPFLEEMSDAFVPSVEALRVDTVELMKAAGKTYDPVIYEGAGHGFMRAGEDPTAVVDPSKTAEANKMIEANKKARDEAWVRWKGILKKL